MRLTWTFLVLGFFVLSNVIDSSGSLTKKSAYVNSDLAFSLEPTNPHQEILEGESLKNLNRDAIVGIVDRNQSFYSLIIVSQFERLSVKDFARVILDELPVQNKKIHSFKERAFQNNPGVNLSFEGELEGQILKYDIDFIYFKDIIYQHVSFMLVKPDQAKLSDLKPKFSLLLDLDPKINSPKEESSRFGLAWYIDESEFAHLGYGISAPSKINGFRTIWGEDAEFFHPESLIGYEAEIGDRSVYLVATKDFHDIESFITHWKKSFADSSSLKRIVSKSNEYAILDYDSSDKLLRYQIKFMKGNSSSIALVQFSLPTNNDLMPVSLLVNTRFLKGKTYSDAFRKLRGPQYSRLILGDRESFYQNTYTNFDLGIRWQLPANEVVEAGFQNNKQIQTEYSLYLENFSKNYFATLQIEEDQFQESLQYHRENLPQSESLIKENTREKLGFYYTPFRIKDQDYNYLYMTSRHSDVYLRMLVWSKTELDAETFIKQINLESIDELILESDVIKHNKLGFKLIKPDTYKVKRITPEEIAPVGEVMQFYNALREHALYVIRSDLLDQELVLDLYLQQHSYKNLIKGEIRNLKYLGLEVNQRKFTVPVGSRTKILIQRSLRRGDTFFSTFSLVEPAVQDQSQFFETFKLTFDRPGWN